MSHSLEFKSISKTYPRGELPAVHEVDLALNHGETLALVGESGSGKTTLLRLAAGLESPDSGEVYIRGELVAGKSAWTPPEKRRVGMIFQDGALFPHLNAELNILFGIRKESSEQRRSVVDFMLAMVGLGGKNKRYPHELSGGERQRLALARTLATQPEFLLMDEPFSSLDSTLRRELRDEVHSILKKLNATSILVTHDTEDALRIGDRIAILRGGKLAQSGTKSEVYHNPVDGYCAKLFGAANLLPAGLNGPDRWIRLEDISVAMQATGSSIPAKIVRIADLGKYREATVALEDSLAGREWQVILPSTISCKAGQLLHLELPGIRQAK